MKEDAMEPIADWIMEVIQNVDDESVLERIREAVEAFVVAYPAPAL